MGLHFLYHLYSRFLLHYPFGNLRNRVWVSISICFSFLLNGYIYQREFVLSSLSFVLCTSQLFDLLVCAPSFLMVSFFANTDQQAPARVKEHSRKKYMQTISKFLYHLHLLWRLRNLLLLSFIDFRSKKNSK